jgi:hypothetical protein
LASPFVPDGKTVASDQWPEKTNLCCFAGH